MPKPRGVLDPNQCSSDIMLFQRYQRSQSWGNVETSLPWFRKAPEGPLCYFPNRSCLLFSFISNSILTSCIGMTVSSTSLLYRHGEYIFFCFVLFFNYCINIQPTVGHVVGFKDSLKSDSMSHKRQTEVDALVHHPEAPFGTEILIFHRCWE